MTKDAVSIICDEIAPQYYYDPRLILAMCEQESNYNEKAIRLENNFFRKYIQSNNQFNIAEETSKILLSCSYGLTQVMGVLLYEKKYITSLASQDVNDTLMEFLKDPKAQIKLCCIILHDKLKYCADQNNTEELLLKYNGGGNPNYGKEVLARIA